AFVLHQPRLSGSSYEGIRRAERFGSDKNQPVWRSPEPGSSLETSRRPGIRPAIAVDQQGATHGAPGALRRDLIGVTEDRRGYGFPRVPLAPRVLTARNRLSSP